MYNIQATRSSQRQDRTQSDSLLFEQACGRTEDAPTDERASATDRPSEQVYEDVRR